MTIFLDNLDFRTFTQLFRETVEDYKIDCWNYCAMPNHYHATLRPTLANISRAIQHLNASYAQWWNRRHGRVGHVFQGRFKAQIVQLDGYALTLSRYVALNPVRAQLVTKPEDWRWSSYASLIGLRPSPPFLDVDATLTLFGDGEATLRRQRFADFVLAGYEDETDDDRIRSNTEILGDAAFRASIDGEPLNRGHDDP
jgi:REP element-mobilizing transposase RayT